MAVWMSSLRPDQIHFQTECCTATNTTHIPGISEMKRSTFHCSTSCVFFKNGEKQEQIQRCKKLLKRKDVICKRIKYGRSKDAFL